MIIHHLDTVSRCASNAHPNGFIDEVDGSLTKVNCLVCLALIGQDYKKTMEALNDDVIKEQSSRIDDMDQYVSAVAKTRNLTVLFNNCIVALQQVHPATLVVQTEKEGRKSFVDAANMLNHIANRTALGLDFIQRMYMAGLDAFVKAHPTLESKPNDLKH